VAAKEINPQNVTVRGRLSFPNFVHSQAVARNLKSKFPKADAADVQPDFNLLLEQAQLDKLVAHVTDVFLPYCAEQHKKQEKRNALEPKLVARILKQIEAADWEDQPPYLPIKPVHDKTALLAPEAVASLKIVGNKGQDIQLKARVNDESELAIPDANQLTFPVLKPINETVHNMYGGCYVAATLNLYAYDNGGASRGFSAGAGVAVFIADGEPFGGGAVVDEDEMFMD
jgi:hypothetical protein